MSTKHDAAGGNDHTRARRTSARRRRTRLASSSARSLKRRSPRSRKPSKPSISKRTGLQEPGLTKLIHAGYDLLGLQTYFTVGPKEARAWTIHKGWTAPQAAGVIHGDFEKGFIRAETIAYADFIANGGEQGAKEAGKMRLEGKDYIVREGDVMHFRFNA